MAQDDRKRRLAEQLRANLQRRKAQARSRREDAGSAHSADEAADDDPGAGGNSDEIDGPPRSP